MKISTVVYLPPEEVYEFLLDFPRYTNYSKYLEEVRQDGDGGPGTEYELRFAWWKVGYTVESRVTDTENPDRIDWEITEDIDATGAWVIEDAPEEAEDPPEGVEADAASRIYLVADYDLGSVGQDSVRLPRLVSLSWVVERAKPIARREAKQVVARAVHDLEGSSRPIELTVHEQPDEL